MNRQWIGRRLLLKLSGEALMGERAFGIDPNFVGRISQELAEIARGGVELAVVVGGGNLFRGVQLASGSMDRVSADHMGMLATVMNGIALRAALKERNVEAEIFSGLPVPSVCDTFSQRGALAALEAGKVVIFVAGTGSPYFTTDTGAALRAAEMGCDVLMKGTQVDGVYTADPKKDPSAERLPRVTFDEVLAKDLAVMDTAAMALARSAKIEIIVFSLHEPGSIVGAAAGEGAFSRVVVA